MRVIFLGTPDFAVPSFNALVASRHEVVAAVTQPDRPRDRGKVSACPVKLAAQAAGVPVFQFEKIRDGGADALRGLGADVMVTCAYGQRLDETLLELTPHAASKATYVPMFRKQDGRIDPGMTVAKFVNFVRGTSPWPGAFCRVGGKLLKVHKARALRGDEPCTRRLYFPGEFAVFFGRLHLAFSDGLAVLEEVQPEGGKRMSGAAYALGHADINGKRADE